MTPSPLTMSPSPASPITSPAMSVAGHFHADGGGLSTPQFDWVSVGVVWDKGGPGPPPVGPYTYCGPNPPSGPPAGACAGNDFDFTQQFAPPPSYNGPYKVSATGKATDQFFGQSDTKSTPEIKFKVAVPPGPATGVTATVDKNRQVTVSWNRDATTPDVQTYWIWRKAPGAKDFIAVSQTPQIPGGARMSVLDTTTAGMGGDYVYQVETRRNGPNGDMSPPAISDRSKSASPKVTVPDPPPGTPTTPPTQPGPTGSSGAPPVVKSTPTGGSRSAGFSSGVSSSSGEPVPTTEPVTPDPGYLRGLPYAGQGPKPSQGQEGDNAAVALTPGGRQKSDRKGVLVPVATGAILFVGAFQLRVLKKRLDEPTALT